MRIVDEEHDGSRAEEGGGQGQEEVLDSEHPLCDGVRGVRALDGHSAFDGAGGNGLEKGGGRSLIRLTNSGWLTLTLSLTKEKASFVKCLTPCRGSGVGREVGRTFIDYFEIWE